MRYIALSAATIVPGDNEGQLVVREKLNNGVAATESSRVFHARFYQSLDRSEEASYWSDPIQEESADFDDFNGITGWKRVLAWTGAAVICWAALLGCLAILRAIW